MEASSNMNNPTSDSDDTAAAEKAHLSMLRNVAPAPSGLSFGTPPSAAPAAAEGDGGRQKKRQRGAEPSGLSFRTPPSAAPAVATPIEELFDLTKPITRVERPSIKNQGDKIQRDRKDAKAVFRFIKLEDMQATIKNLQYRQEAISVKLPDEKRFTKEIDNFLASKALVADLNASLESVKEQRETISQQISAKDTEIDDVRKDIDTKSTEIEGMADKETDKRDALKGLFTKRDTLCKQMNEKMKERDVLQQVYHDAYNSWYMEKSGMLHRLYRLMMMQATIGAKSSQKEASLLVSTCGSIEIDYTNR